MKGKHGGHWLRHSSEAVLCVPFQISPLSSLRSLFRPPAPFSLFPLFHHDRSRVYTTIVRLKGGGGRGFCKKGKKKKNFSPLRIIRDKKGTFFVGSFHLIFHDAGGRKKKKKIFRPYLHLLSATWKRIIALLSEGTVYERF